MRHTVRSGIVWALITSFIFIPLCSRVDASILRHFIYQPDPLPAVLDWGQVPAPEQITVRTDDGLDLVGFRWPATTPDHDTLIFFHGNAGNRYDAALMVAPLRRPDTEIIVASYRGYGGNPGRPSEAGLYRDGAAFLHYGQTSRPRRFYLFGFSLGGAVALHLAADPSVTGVITLGAFSRLGAVAPRWVGAFLPDRFDNIASARQLHVPYLLMHGSADDVVPFAEASKLKAAANGHARFVAIKGAEHNIDLDHLAPVIWDHVAEMTSRPALRTEQFEREPVLKE